MGGNLRKATRLAPFFIRESIEYPTILLGKKAHGVAHDLVL
jgi:hypothetical protein